MIGAIAANGCNAQRTLEFRQIFRAFGCCPADRFVCDGFADTNVHRVGTNRLLAMG